MTEQRKDAVWAAFYVAAFERHLRARESPSRGQLRDMAHMSAMYATAQVQILTDAHDEAVNDHS